MAGPSAAERGITVNTENSKATVTTGRLNVSADKGTLTAQDGNVTAEGGTVTVDRQRRGFLGFGRNERTVIDLSAARGGKANIDTTTGRVRVEPGRSGGAVTVKKAA